MKRAMAGPPEHGEGKGTVRKCSVNRAWAGSERVSDKIARVRPKD